MPEIIESPNGPLSVQREVIVTPPDAPLPNARYTYVDDSPVIVRSGSDLPIEHRGLVIAVMSMVAISFLTFWVPLFGSLLAGAVGGFFARRWGRAFTAAAVASVAVPVMLFVLNGFKPGGSMAFLLGLTFAQWIVMHVVSLFVGAATGVYSRPLSERGLPEKPLTVE
jgi:hypothetical protein